MAEVAVRVVLALVVALGLLLPATGAAQSIPGAPIPEGDLDVPAGDSVIVVVPEGGRAPFSGQLFDNATALRWGNRIVRYRMRISLLEDELRTCRDESEASAVEQLRIAEESYMREIEGLRTDLRDQATRYEGELARFRNPPFYETWGFAFGMGVLATGIVVGVLAALFASL